MKKLLISLLTLFTFFACSDPGSSDNGGNDNKVYSIIFNLPQIVIEKSCALLIVDKNGLETKIGEGLYVAWDYTFTEDGSKVVYRSFRLDNQQPVIVISDVDNLTDTYLSMEFAMQPKVSPDGKYIAFLQNNYDNPDSSGLFVMDIDGTNIYKLIDKDELIGLQNWDWSSDSEGINYEVYTLEYKTYLIDKDGNSDPVEIDPIWIHITSNEDKTFYSLDGFDRAALPTDAIMDSIGFYYYQLDDQGEKAWTFLSYYKSWRPPVVNFYLLGYDFKAKSERFLVDTTITSNNMKVSWSPDYKDIAVVSIEGLYISQIDGSNQKILEYSIQNIDQNTVLQWIAKRD